MKKPGPDSGPGSQFVLQVDRQRVHTLELLHINVQRFRGGLVFKAHRLCVSLNSGLDSNKEEEEDTHWWSNNEEEEDIPWWWAA